MEKTQINIKYVAELARLEIQPSQTERLQNDLQNIVEYINQLNELDLAGVEPTAHATTLANVWRNDEIGTTFDRELLLANAPALLNENLIRMPQVLPGEGIN